MARRKFPRAKPKKKRRGAPSPGGAKGATKGVPIPKSGRSGIYWPAMPRHVDAMVLALQYQFEQSQWWPAETLLQYQLRQLELLLAHAARTVPLYRDRLGVLAGTRRGELTMAAFHRLPLLSRTEIQEVGDGLISRRPPKDHGRLCDIKTSGSTGRPIKVKGTDVTGLFFAALNLRYHLWHGRDISGKVACIRNLNQKQAQAAKNGKPTTWVPGYRSGPMYFFSINRPISEQMDWLVGQDADYLLTFPSNLMALLRHSADNGIKPAKLSQVVTMSEVLDPAVRVACANVWNASVTDAYSSEELGMIALQCPDFDHYHVQAESLFVEILDEEGALCAPGQVGRIVLTDLHNFASPLIRYEIGDYAEVGEACPCGRGLPVLNRIVGRTRNMLTLPTGDKIWPSFPSARMVPIAPIRQFQIIQHDLQRIEARLVAARALTDDEVGRLRAFLAGCLRHDFKLELVFVDEIARSPGGKYEDFVSRVGA
jgi:phenylacetate-CoA ligase